MSEEQTTGMTVTEAIRRKRAVRSYAATPVPEELIETILNAGRRAQSSKNSQPWSFILLTERERMQHLSTAGSFAAHMPHAAFVVVLVGTPGYEFDLGQAAAYMQLAATEQGIGSCVTTLHDSDAAHAILGVPAELTCRWSITFGYPAEAQPPLKAGGRKPLAEIVRRERY